MFLAAPTADDCVTAAQTYAPGRLYGLIATELCLLPVLATILYVRGWRLADFPMGIGRRETLLGVLMAAGSFSACAFVADAFIAIFPSIRSGLADVQGPAAQHDFIAIYLLSLLNPVFEEVFVCGYVIKALRRRFGETAAINVSVVIRAAYHLYQGIAAAPYHVTYGLIQAYAFTRYRKLWPLIVSHALLDFFALLTS